MIGSSKVAKGKAKFGPMATKPLVMSEVSIAKKTRSRWKNLAAKAQACGVSPTLVWKMEAEVHFAVQT